MEHILVEDVEMTDVDEGIEVEEDEEELTERQIGYQSLKLRKEYGKAAITHAFLQFIHDRSIQVLKYSSYWSKYFSVKYFN